MVGNRRNEEWKILFRTRVPCNVAFETGLLTPQLLVKFLMTVAIERMFNSGGVETRVERALIYLITCSENGSKSRTLTLHINSESNN